MASVRVNHQRIEVTAELLARIPLLQRLDESQLEAWCTSFKGFRYEPNCIIVSREEPSHSVYFVVCGEVQASAFSAKGRQVDFELLGPGELFGEIAAIDGGVRSVDIVTVRETVVLELTDKNFARMVDEHDSVRWLMMERLADRVRRLSDRVYDLTSKSAPVRIREELLRRAKLGATQDGVLVIDPAPTDQEIANVTGSQREVVNREVNRLAAGGVLERLPSSRELGRCRIEVYQADALVQERVAY